MTPVPSRLALDAGSTWIATQAAGKIVLVSRDGSRFVPFTSVPAGEQLHPDWSPDGSQLSFAILGATGEIWSGGADGANARRLVACVAPCMWVDEAAWSPDGTQLVYQRMSSVDGVEVSTLEIVDVRSGEVRVVATAPKGRGFFQPRWGPDASKVVTEYSNSVEGRFLVALAIVDVSDDVPEPVEITEARLLTNSPDWSWSTDLIVFVRPSTDAGFEGPSDLVVMRPDGTGARAITNVDARGDQTPQPAFIPDGKYVIFVQADGTLGLISADGVVAARVTNPVTGAWVEGLHPRYRPKP